MKRLFSIAAGLTLLFLLTSFLFPAPFEFLERKWQDQYFKFRGELAPKNKIALVTIDEKSINQLGRWPWPRSIMARLVDRLSEYAPRAVGLDITFSEGSEEDALFAEALKKNSNLFLGYFFYLSSKEAIEAGLSSKNIEEEAKTIFPSRLSLSSKQAHSSGIAVYGVQANVPVIAEGASKEHQGFFNIVPDSDGVIREAPLILFYKDFTYPSLALRLASFIQGFSPIPIFHSKGDLEGISLGDEKIPLDHLGKLKINYRGAQKTFPHFSIVDVLERRLPLEALQNHIVLIGATAVGIYDMRVTPVQSTFPGVEVQANILDTLLSGDFLIFDETMQMVSFLLILFTGLFFGIFISKLKALPSFFVFFGWTILLLGFGYFLFIKRGLLINMMKPALNGFFVYGGLTLYRYFTEEKERRKIRNTFQYYLSPIVIQELLEHPERLRLGGERKELTVLFSDIRGFTAESENLPPEEVVQLLNEYFTVMTEIVFKYGGTLDKYMGDAIMAFFGAPIFYENHAWRASQVALEMIAAVDKNRKNWCEKFHLKDFQIGIGIHTGAMAVGNMGSLKRFDYTVIGDAVNLASRLESLNKEYGTQILISDAHYQCVKNKVAAKEIGSVRVRGKQEMTVVHELLKIQ